MTKYERYSFRRTTGNVTPVANQAQRIMVLRIEAHNRNAIERSILEWFIKVVARG